MSRGMCYGIKRPELYVVSRRHSEARPECDILQNVDMRAIPRGTSFANDSPWEFWHGEKPTTCFEGQNGETIFRRDRRTPPIKHATFLWCFIIILNICHLVRLVVYMLDKNPFLFYLVLGPQPEYPCIRVISSNLGPSGSPPLDSHNQRTSTTTFEEDVTSSSTRC